MAKSTIAGLLFQFLLFHLMHRSSSYVRKTRRGNIIKIVKEHYLRDDLYCGSKQCTICQQTPDDAHLTGSQYLIVDTNVVLHQLDLLETSRQTTNDTLPNPFHNIIYLSTVLSEVRPHSSRLYSRVRQLISERTSTHAHVFVNEHHRSTYVERLPGETMNDRNDRAIRTAVHWYTQHVSDHAKILLLTNDIANRDKARREGLNAITMEEYVQSYATTHPHLLELVARMKVDETNEKEEWKYDEYLPTSEIKMRVASGSLKRGTFRVSRDFWSEASVSVKGYKTPILISGMKTMNRAIDGDIVIIEILPESQWQAPNHRIEPSMEEESVVINDMNVSEEQRNVEVPEKEQVIMDVTSTVTTSTKIPTGRVVGIEERNWRPYCGSLEVTDKKRGTVLFLCINKRIPRIRIETRQIESLMDKRIMVQIDSWPVNSRYPLGHYVRTLGDMGDKDTETQVLLLEHDIPTAPWTKSVLKCLPKDEPIAPSEIARRLDLRKTIIFSIDPPGCTDIDDALHVRQMENGNLEVGVHIADVSHYIPPDNALDQEAANRGTSVYLVDRRIDMLPNLLSTNMCSLRAREERLAFSVLWEMTPDAEIVDTQFKKTVIQTAAAYTYQQAQDRLDLPGDSDPNDPTVWCCKTLNHLAIILNRKRREAGALTLASTEIKFVIDKQSQQPTDVAMYQMKQANSLVEEFMLLANISVAKRILEEYPAFSLLRRHPIPNKENFDPLIRAGRAAGFEIRVDTSKQLADSLDACQVPGNPFFNKLIRILATRCMTQAIYFSSGDLPTKDYFHYGLAAPIYTHFTSPIRRYADIVVHRLLAACIGWDKIPSAVQDRERVRLMSENINHRHRMAQLVGRASGELFTLIYFKDKRVTETALIVAVRSNGIRVIIQKFGLEGAITLYRPESGTTNPYTYNEEAMTLTSSTQSFAIFQQVQVVIYVQESKSRRRWLTIELADSSASSTASGLLPSHAPTPTPAPAPTTTTRDVPMSTENDADDIMADDDEDATPATKKKRTASKKSAASGNKRRKA